MPTTGLSAATSHMDQEGAVRVLDLLGLRDPPKGWTRVEHYWNVFRHIHAKLSLIVTCCREADGHLWAHLSVAGQHRLPTWDELKTVRDWIVGPETKAIQVLPPRAEHVNLAEYCLHLWCCLDGDPLPDFRKDGLV